VEAGWIAIVFRKFAVAFAQGGSDERTDADDEVSGSSVEMATTKCLEWNLQNRPAPLCGRFADEEFLGFPYRVFLDDN
jgi:hypothetical protein